MPLPDTEGRPVHPFFRHWAESFAGDRSNNLFYAPSGAATVTRIISPSAILEAVREMSGEERAELAELLGVESRHSMLYLPGNSGGFLPPIDHEAEPPWLIRAKALPQPTFD